MAERRIEDGVPQLATAKAAPALAKGKPRAWV